MAKRKYKTAKGKEEMLSEPGVIYNNSVKKRRESIIISSVTEQEESNYLYWLSLSPEERWAEHYKLLERIYGKETIHKNHNYKIIFD